MTHFGNRIAGGIVRRSLNGAAYHHALRVADGRLFNDRVYTGSQIRESLASGKYH
jgi:hypothetical protein